MHMSSGLNGRCARFIKERGVLCTSHAMRSRQQSAYISELYHISLLFNQAVVLQAEGVMCNRKPHQTNEHHQTKIVANRRMRERGLSTVSIVSFGRYSEHLCSLTTRCRSSRKIPTVQTETPFSRKKLRQEPQRRRGIKEMQGEEKAPCGPGWFRRTEK